MVLLRIIWTILLSSYAFNAMAVERIGHVQIPTGTSIEGFLTQQQVDKILTYYKYEVGSEEANDFIRRYSRRKITSGQEYNVIDQFRDPNNDRERYYLLDVGDGWQYWIQSSSVRLKPGLKENCSNQGVYQRRLIKKIEVPNQSRFKTSEEFRSYLDENTCQSVESANKRKPAGEFKDDVCGRFDEYKPLIKRLTRHFDQMHESVLSCITMVESNWKGHVDKHKVVKVAKGNPYESQILDIVERSFVKSKVNFSDAMSELAERVSNPAAIDSFWEALGTKAVGNTQIKEEAVVDTAIRITVNPGSSNLRDKSIYDSWRGYMSEMASNCELVPNPKVPEGEEARCKEGSYTSYERSFFVNANTQRVNSWKPVKRRNKSGNPVYTNVTTSDKKKPRPLETSWYMQNRAMGLAVAASQMSLALWTSPSQRYHTLEAYILASGAYNRGRSVFDDLPGCDRFNFNNCMQDAKRACEMRVSKFKNKRNAHSGWYEGYRYMVKMQRCLTKGDNRPIEMPDGVCPSFDPKR